MGNRCPHCGESLVEDCKYCKSCGRIAVDYVFCEKCREPMPRDAVACSHCSFTRKSAKDKAAETLEMEVRATHLGALFGGGSITGVFLPPIIRVHGGRITVTKWSLLGLRRHVQEIQVSRVASVRYTKGVFWGGLLVETFGGAAEDLSEKGLRQEDAKSMTDQLKSVLQD